MSDCLHDFDFTEDTFFVVFVLNGVFVDDLDGDLLVGGSVDSLLHFAKGTLSKGFAKAILSNDLGKGVFQLLGLGDADLIS